MLSCPTCGNENPDTSRFCSQCGTRLPDSGDSTATIPVLASGSRPTTPGHSWSVPEATAP